MYLLCRFALGVNILLVCFVHFIDCEFEIKGFGLLHYSFTVQGSNFTTGRRNSYLIVRALMREVMKYENVASEILGLISVVKLFLFP